MTGVQTCALPISDEWDNLLRSYRVHGKGHDKYDNVRIGMNSRLDTIQAAILNVKLQAFEEHELDDVNRVADMYTDKLGLIGTGTLQIKRPVILNGYESSWAQYTILLDSESQRNMIVSELKENGIPAMIYYPKGLSKQKAFEGRSIVYDVSNSERVSETCMSLPMGPYLRKADIESISEIIEKHLIEGHRA